MVYVTHDQVEAMTLGDRIVVMHEGRVQQAGAPLELYQQPANRFVALFIGSPTINLVPARVISTGQDGLEIALDDDHRVYATVYGMHLLPGAPVELGIRPEHFVLAQGEASPAAARFACEVSLVEQLGESHLIHARGPGGIDLVARSPGHTRLRPGERIELEARAEMLYVFDRDGRACLRLFPEGHRHG